MLNAIDATPASAIQADLARRIDAVLPQTQCTKCGFTGCRPYAEALAAGSAEINQCPPGGAAGIAKLAALTGRPVLALSPVNGIEAPLRLAVVDEALCIGCTLCIEACPVDAIVGTAKRMHTVLASSCTGCDLCVAPCPMDCIAMVPPQPPRFWADDDAQVARHRFEARNHRLAQAQMETEERWLAKAIAKLEQLEASDVVSDHQLDERKARVAEAIERARRRRQQPAASPLEAAATKADR